MSETAMMGEIEALVARLRGIAVCEPSPEPADTMREAAEAITRLNHECQHSMTTIAAERERREAVEAELVRVKARADLLEAVTDTPLWSHRALTGLLHDIISTRFGVRFMDPPDGGDVRIHEQVDRMADALVAAEARALTAEAALANAVEALPFIRDPKTQHAFEIMTAAIRARTNRESP